MKAKIILHPPLYDPLFAKKASCHMKMLKFINTVTVELKNRGLTLHEDRCIEDSLIESVGEEKNNRPSSLFASKFESKYISSTASIVKYKSLKDAVVKIQEVDADSLTR